MLLERCVSVSPGEIDGKVLQELQDKGYDQAPVLDRSGEALGIIATTQLAQLHEASRPLTVEHPGIDRTRVPSDADLDLFLETMSRRRATIVLAEDTPYGLVTVSDLNRHPLRAALYRIFADLETSLAAFVAATYVDPWKWIPHLSEDHQVQVLGFWEVTRRAGVDTGPLAGCTLTNLISVVVADEGLRKALGYRSGNEARKLLGGFPRLRNKVMHPVRPLVLGTEDVARIRHAVRHALELCQRLREMVLRS